MRCCGWRKGWIALSILAKAIVCPLAGRGKVEFEVVFGVDRSNEDFTASVLPQTIAGARHLVWRHPNIRRVANDAIAQRQPAIAGELKADLDCTDWSAWCVGVAVQRILDGGGQSFDFSTGKRGRAYFTCSFSILLRSTGKNGQNRGLRLVG